MNLLVGVAVHEHEIGTFLVQEGHRALVHRRGLDLGPGVEGAVNYFSGEHVLQSSAHEGPALAGLDVLELDNGPQLAVEVEDQAVLQVVRGCHECAILLGSCSSKPW